MKKKFLNTCINIIKKNEPNIDQEKLDEIKYGLEGIYLTISKTVIIFSLAIILGIFKEMILLLLFFNVLRTTAFGIHAKKSWMCWISSISIFILIPFISRYIVLPFNLKIILGISGVLLIFLFAPADTVKHPLINKKKRIIWKVLSVFNCSIFILISLLSKNELISTIIIFSIYIEILLINPLSYKIFKLPYDNYKKYIELNT